MKHPLDDKTVDWVEESNAVLTPHLIHPNYFKRKGSFHTHHYKQEVLPPVRKHEVEARKRWCKQQLSRIGQFGAVLGEVK